MLQAIAVHDMAINICFDRDDERDEVATCSDAHVEVVLISSPMRCANAICSHSLDVMLCIARGSRSVFGAFLAVLIAGIFFGFSLTLRTTRTRFCHHLHSLPLFHCPALMHMLRLRQLWM